MFKVGDVLNVKGGRRGDRYRVIETHPDGRLVLRNIALSDESKNFRANISDNLVLDNVYYRRLKLDKIMDNIDSFNILERAKASAEKNREEERLRMLKIRKEKLLNIQSNIDSLYLKEYSEKLSALSRRADYLLVMENRKRKLKKICSKLEIK